jgi:hypothetical protein
MLTKKWLLAGIFTLLSLSLAMAAPPAVHPTTGEPLVITCLKGTPEAIDGDLSDWNLDAMTPAVLDAAAQVYTGQATWSGPADCSGKFYLLWDDKKIYVAVEVKDDKFSNNKTDGNIWNGDCVEVFFGTTNAVAPHAEHYQYGFTANGQKWNWCNMDSAGQVLPDYVETASKRTPDGYICEASIEYGRMSALSFTAGTTIGFHPCIDDTDATDREGQITWTGREAHDQNLGFGYLILSSDPASPKELGHHPSPARGAVDVPMDVVLAWTPGKFAASHDLYLGTAADAVNDATRNNPMGVLVSQGRPAAEFDPTGLAYGQTYYWRVDEVNAPPAATIYKGDVWSFTTETYTYTLTGVTVTASSASVTTGNTAAKTVDGSGLDAATGQHSSGDADGWISLPGVLPAWIQYEFDQPYLIRQMKVWNSNTKIEPYVGYGVKSVLIEYSTDGTTWTPLRTEEFPQADGSDTYAGFTVEMGDVQAKFVRLTIESNWGGFIPQYGLSEVRFSYIPVQAFAPQPATAATGVSVDASLNWRPGRQASSHKVFFGVDQAAVAGGTVAAKTVTEHSYVPGSLNFGTTYYWKVDEVNTVTYPGNLWSFSTLEYMSVDDFESYTNDSPDRVFQAWIDGMGFSADQFFPAGNSGNGSGSLVGYDPAAGDIMETSIVHGGTQAMPVEYNNVNAPYYSEVERTFDAAQNWTTNGAADLSLWFRGQLAAFVETASGVTVSGAGADIYNGTDEFRFVYKKLTGDGSITVRVDSVQTAASWTKTGVMIRDGLVPLAMQVHMISAAQQSLVEWMYRSASNSAITTQFNTAANTNPLPVWLRVTRAGNVFTGECSANGTTWTKITGADGTPSSTTITMPASVYVGMVVCSQSAGNLAVANFSQIKTSANVTGQWQVADIGVAQPANKPDPLYVVIQDSANKTVVVKHPDGVNAVLTDQWTQWKIPLSQLAGVNTKAVKKMTIGIGDRAGSKAGGAGMLFIDDIGYGRPLSSQ